MEEILLYVPGNHDTIRSIKLTFHVARKKSPLVYMFLGFEEQGLALLQNTVSNSARSIFRVNDGC